VAIFGVTCRCNEGFRRVEDIYSLLNSGSDIQSIGSRKRKTAKRFVEDFLPTIDYTSGLTSCRVERQENSWIHNLMASSENELIAWHASVLDYSASKRAKSERRRGRCWCAYDDFLLLHRGSQKSLPARCKTWVSGITGRWIGGLSGSHCDGDLNMQTW
jgi:hypothetical protein